MPELQNEIDRLILHYLRGDLSEAEQRTLKEWREALPANELLFQKLTDRAYLSQEFGQLADFDAGSGWQELVRRKKDSVPMWRRISEWRVAASLLLVVAASVAVWILVRKNNDHSLAGAATERFKNDVPPGREGAYLTLDNGQRILLDSMQHGELPVQGMTKLVNTNGTLVYEGNGEINPANKINTLSTPRGRKFRLVLADGTQVWLNASSSVTYPVVFPDSARTISIRGEAYIEVAKQVRQGYNNGATVPFRVQTNGMEIEVLGTHFNVSAYEDEDYIRTTLMEGMVRVKPVNEQQGTAIVLAPGERADWKNGTPGIRKSKADIEEALAWKNDLFWFNQSDITAVMRQLSRWYDIDVIMDDRVGQHFSGTIPRMVNLMTVLKTLEQTNGVKFKIEGKNVYVLKGENS